MAYPLYCDIEVIDNLFLIHKSVPYCDRICLSFGQTGWLVCLSQIFFSQTEITKLEMETVLCMPPKITMEPILEHVRHFDCCLWVWQQFYLSGPSYQRHILITGLHLVNYFEKLVPRQVRNAGIWVILCELNQVSNTCSFLSL